MSVLSVPVGTKQCVPRLPDPWLERKRLNQACERVGAGEAMLLAAFAGAGKTTLLADWFTNGCIAPERAWLTVDPRDNAPGRLSVQLARALGAGEALGDLDGRLCSDQLMLDRVFEHLAERDQPTVLVLDDVHELTSRPALAALSHLLTALPPTLSVFLATASRSAVAVRAHAGGRPAAPTPRGRPRADARRDGRAVRAARRVPVGRGGGVVAATHRRVGRRYAPRGSGTGVAASTTATWWRTSCRTTP